MLRKNVANCFTALRIICTIIMLFLETLTLPFLVIYTIAGISDVVDGYLARKMKIESDFGRKLDSVADLSMYGVLFIKIWDRLNIILPDWNITGIWIIVAVRIVNYLYVYIRHHAFAAVHTILNKLTGVFLFPLPYLINTRTITVYAVFVLTLAFAAACYELYLNISNYDFKY